MTRLIDADAVYKIIESYEIKEALGKPLDDWEFGYNCGIERAISEIECAPTIDAEPVIRCKDCVYHGEHKTCMRGDGLTVANDYDYCSNGVRKEE